MIPLYQVPCACRRKMSCAQYFSITWSGNSSIAWHAWPAGCRCSVAVTKSGFDPTPGDANCTECGFLYTCLGNTFQPDKCEQMLAKRSAVLPLSNHPEAAPNDWWHQVPPLQKLRILLAFFPEPANGNAKLCWQNLHTSLAHVKQEMRAAVCKSISNRKSKPENVEQTQLKLRTRTKTNSAQASPVSSFCNKGL